MKAQVSWKVPVHSSTNDALLYHSPGGYVVSIDDGGAKLGELIVSIMGANGTDVRVELVPAYLEDKTPVGQVCVEL